LINELRDHVHVLEVKEHLAMRGGEDDGDGILLVAQDTRHLVQRLSRHNEHARLV